MYVIKDFSSGSLVSTSVNQKEIRLFSLFMKEINIIFILPSGSNRRVTPYSFSTILKAFSRRSLGRSLLAFRQSSKSGRLRCKSAENAKPSRHDDVKSLTRTPGYRAVERRAQRKSASRADTLSSLPTIISEICLIQK